MPNTPSTPSASQFHIFNCDKCNYTKVFTHFKVAQVKTIRRIHKKICKKAGRTVEPQTSEELMDKSEKKVEGKLRAASQQHHHTRLHEVIEP